MSARTEALWRDLNAPQADGSECVMFNPLLPAISNLRPSDGMESYTSTFTPRTLITSAAIRPPSSGR